MSNNRNEIAPKERINVTLKPVNNNIEENRELPFKVMVLGDFTQREDERPLEDRKPINIHKNNFDEVLEKQNIQLTIDVDNELAESAEEQGENLNITLNLKSMKDFNPASIVQQVPELIQLMKLRDALVALKGPLGNTPAFRKAIESVLNSPEAREHILAELGLQTNSAESTQDA